jgi:hypothetical protein
MSVKKKRTLSSIILFVALLVTFEFTYVIETISLQSEEGKGTTFTITIPGGRI